MKASRGLMSDHHDEHPDDGQERGDQLGQALVEGLADVVDVVRDPAQEVAPRMPVEVPQRQAGELAVDLLTEPVDGPLGDAGHDVGLHPGEDRAQEVEAAEHEQDLRQGREVDARAGRQVHGGHHVRELRLPLCAERGDDLLLRQAGRELPADDPFVDDVRGRAEELRSDDRKGHAADGQHDDDDDACRLGPKVAEQPTECAAEVLRLRWGHAHHPERAARPWTAAGAHPWTSAHATASAAESWE